MESIKHQIINNQKNTSAYMIEEFIRILDSKKCITYELCPDKGGSTANLVTKVKKAQLHDMPLSCNQIDAFVCTDSPLATLKHHAGLASLKLQYQLNKPVICTISMRDKNSLALSSELMGLNEFDIRLFLSLSGDPLKLGDQPQAKAVFEASSLRICELIECLNKGVDYNQNPLQTTLQKIYCFGVINSYAKNFDLLKKKMEQKIKYGILALFTQPIYDVEVANMLLEWLEEYNEKYGRHCTLMQGFFPITRYKSAVFLRDKLPGVFIPDKWLVELEKAANKGIEYERQKGMEMSIELFQSLYKNFPKIHFMNNNNTMNARKILDSIT